jgi:hypothetical protein
MKSFCYVAVLLLASSPALGQSVRASWDAVTLDVNGQPENIRGYHLAWGTNSGGPYPNGQSTANVTQLRIDNLQNGVHYYFVVKAIDQAGNESAWSNEADYIVPLEDCHNGIDDDHDGRTDCGDSECVGATEEVCDGADNDCDGSTDEGCPCSQGQTRDCSTDEGECVKGQQVCDAQGNWGTCDGILPADEVCDGKDNDCDGLTDEGDVCGVPDGGADGADGGADTGADGGQPTEREPLLQGGCSCSQAAGCATPLPIVILLLTWLRRKK